MKIPKSNPNAVFRFLEAVKILEPCTIAQIRAEMKAQWPPVSSAKTFSEHFGLIETIKKEIRLSEISRRMLRYTGTKRIDFLISHVRLIDKEPFNYLVRTLKESVESFDDNRIALLIRNKFDSTSRWTKEESENISNCYMDWLELLRLIKKESNEYFWVGGKVSVFDVTALAELNFLQDRTLYDAFVENYHTPKNMLDVPHELLSSISLEKNENKRGKLFEDFIASSFSLLGFSYRRRLGPREKEKKLNYKSNKGGGDVVLLSHFPIHTISKEFVGCALACEAKSTEGQVGSNAVGQARNLKVKVEEIYPEYLIFPVVVSRAKYGYDISGRNIAPPDVVLLTQDIVIEMCKTQKRKLENGNKLILPVHVLSIIDTLIKSEKLEPTIEDINLILEKIN